jgi:hypothetical protein
VTRHYHDPLQRADNLKASLVPTQCDGLPTKTVRGLLSAPARIGLYDYRNGRELQNGNEKVDLTRGFWFLEGFPLVHQVADFPH